MKDKRSFSLKRSFEQPVWIQQITRNWSLNNAKKFLHTLMRLGYSLFYGYSFFNSWELFL